MIKKKKIKYKMIKKIWQKSDLAEFSSELNCVDYPMLFLINLKIIKELCLLYILLKLKINGNVTLNAALQI